MMSACHICGESEVGAPYMLRCSVCDEDVCEAHRETDYDGERQTVRCDVCRRPPRCERSGCTAPQSRDVRHYGERTSGLCKRHYRETVRW